MRRAFHRALPNRRRDKQRHARESSQANSNSASGGEDVLPISGGLNDLRMALSDLAGRSTVNEVAPANTPGRPDEKAGTKAGEPP